MQTESIAIDAQNRVYFIFKCRAVRSHARSNTLSTQYGQFKWICPCCTVQFTLCKRTSERWHTDNRCFNSLSYLLNRNLTVNSVGIMNISIPAWKRPKSLDNWDRYGTKCKEGKMLYKSAASRTKNSPWKWSKQATRQMSYEIWFIIFIFGVNEAAEAAKKRWQCSQCSRRSRSRARALCVCFCPWETESGRHTHIFAKGCQRLTFFSIQRCDCCCVNHFKFKFFFSFEFFLRSHTMMRIRSQFEFNMSTTRAKGKHGRDRTLEKSFVTFTFYLIAMSEFIVVAIVRCLLSATYYYQTPTTTIHVCGVIFVLQQHRYYHYYYCCCCNLHCYCYRRVLRLCLHEVWEPPELLL